MFVRSCVCLCFSASPLFMLLFSLKGRPDFKWPLSPRTTLNGRLRCQVSHPIQGDKWISTAEKYFLRVHVTEALMGSRANLGEKCELARCCIPSENGFLSCCELPLHPKMTVTLCTTCNLGQNCYFSTTFVYYFSKILFFFNEIMRKLKD